MPVQIIKSNRLAGSVTICGMQFKIVWCERIDTGEEAHGLCDSSNCTLYVRDNVPAQQQRNTIYHEMLHALFAESGAGELLDTPRLNAHDLEESLIRILTPHLIVALDTLDMRKKK